MVSMDWLCRLPDPSGTVDEVGTQQDSALELGKRILLLDAVRGCCERGTGRDGSDHQAIGEWASISRNEGMDVGGKNDETTRGFAHESHFPNIQSANMEKLWEVES